MSKRNATQVPNYVTLIEATGLDETMRLIKKYIKF